MKIIRDEKGKIIGFSLEGLTADLAIGILVGLLACAIMLCRAGGG